MRIKSTFNLFKKFHYDIFISTKKKMIVKIIVIVYLKNINLLFEYYIRVGVILFLSFFRFM